MPTLNLIPDLIHNSKQSGLMFIAPLHSPLFCQQSIRAWNLQDQSLAPGFFYLGAMLPFVLNVVWHCLVSLIKAFSEKIFSQHILFSIDCFFTNVHVTTAICTNYTQCHHEF